MNIIVIADVHSQFLASSSQLEMSVRISRARYRCTIVRATLHDSKTSIGPPPHPFCVPHYYHRRYQIREEKSKYSDDRIHDNLWGKISALGSSVWRNFGDEFIRRRTLEVEKLAGSGRHAGSFVSFRTSDIFIGIAVTRIGR